MSFERCVNRALQDKFLNKVKREETEIGEKMKKSDEWNTTRAVGTCLPN
jgi:hypothetical protein